MGPVRRSNMVGYLVRELASERVGCYAGERGA